MDSKKSVAFIFSVLILSSLISTTNATITREFTEDSYGIYGDLRYTLKVKIVIETEANNMWIAESTYRVTFIITLTYVNQSMWGGDFHMKVFYPSGMPFVPEILGNDTFLTLGDSGTLSFDADAPSYETRVRFEPSFSCDEYRNNEFFMHNSWSSDEPIYIDVETASVPSPFSSELIFAAIGITIGAVAVGSYFIIKTRKKTK